MAKLTIKNESLPQRCEICHQTDSFDALRNFCSRCSNIRDLHNNNAAIVSIIIRPIMDAIAMSILYGFIGAIGGFIVSAIIVIINSAYTHEVNLSTSFLCVTAGLIIGILVGLRSTFQITRAAFLKFVNAIFYSLLAGGCAGALMGAIMAFYYEPYLEAASMGAYKGGVLGLIIAPMIGAIIGTVNFLRDQHRVNEQLRAVQNQLR